MDKHRMHSGYIGKSGEHAVISELLSRGVMVHVPVVDEGVDLIAGWKLRIQVKTRSRENCRATGYNFTLGQKRESDGKWATKVRSKNMAEWFPQIDFLICVGLNERRFWVFPSAFLGNYPTQQSLCLGTGHHHHFDVTELHRQIKSGKRYVDIARDMGISPVTVSGHARGRSNKRKFQDILAVAADKYEGAWHEIESAVRLADEIDSIDSAAARYGGLDFQSLEAEIAAETACKREK